MTDWQQASLTGLANVRLEMVPAVELLLLDDLAAYGMGAGPLAGPYTVEHGSRVVSSLFGAIVDAERYTPERQPEPTESVIEARASFVRGAHDFAARGTDGLVQLMNRLVPAVLGELETHKDEPADQVRSLFYYAMLAVASGPMNLLAESAAAAVMETYQAWVEVLDNGLVLPWRRTVDA